MLKSEALELISRKVSVCTLCSEISEYRKTNNYLTAAGEGNASAEIMFLGEALGKDESEQGRPFVGKSGRLLNSIIHACGWKREEIFITNILRCRPPNNREPTSDEAKNCRKFLDLQIKVINPKWIVCFGRVASVYLLGKDQDTTIGSLRGVIHEWDGRKIIATYHPSFCLRNPAAKADVWNDLQPLVRAMSPII